MHLLFSFATLFSSISNRTCLNWLFVICTASKLLAVQCLCMSARDERRWEWGGGLLWKDVGSVCHKVNFGHAQYHVMCFLTSFNMCVCLYVLLVLHMFYHSLLFKDFPRLLCSSWNGCGSLCLPSFQPNKL